MGEADKTYVYGSSNGESYVGIEGEHADGERHTHWDPRIEVSAPISQFVQVGIVPPSKVSSTDESGVWAGEDGQFLNLSRDGINRLIVALREARDTAFGKDQ